MGGWRLGLVKFSYTKNPESDFFYKESKSNKKKKNLAAGRGGDGGVARVSDFLFSFFFSKESKSEKNKNCFLFEGVKVREDWLV